MAVSVAASLQLTVEETLATNVPAMNSTSVIKHDGFNSSVAMNANTTPPATKAAAFTPTLSGGALTIDLTALTGTQGTVDGTGLKVQAFLFNNIAAASVSISTGASNGYAMLGTSKSVTVPAGASLMMRFNDNLPDISSTAKNIDLAGTGSQAFECVIVMG